MRIRRAFTAVTGALALLLLGQASAAHAPTAAGSIRNVGRWLVAPDGRVVIVHGVNIVPTAPSTSAGVDDRVAAFLASRGFNAVRLGWQMSALEPAPGRFDERYLATLRRTVDLLARHGIYSLIDMHQDEWGPSIGIRGFPAWMTVTDGLPAPATGGVHPLGYWSSPAINRAWKNLWADRRLADGRGIQEHYAAMWQHVAARFRGDPWVLGYDILNEPYPGEGHEYPVGDCWNPAVSAGCPEWDARLAAFDRRVVTALHRVDPAHIAWYEPGQHVFTGRPNHLGKHVTGRAGLSLHAYCLEALGLPQNQVTDAYCADALERTFAEGDRHAAVSGDGLLITEFGATKDPAFWKQLTDLADKHMVPWTMWSYSELAGDWNTAPHPDLKVEAAVVRPFPRAIAGTPISYGFDTSTKTFALAFRTVSPSGGRLRAGLLTEVAVPRLVYAEGYTATVAGGTVVSRPGAAVLLVRTRAGSAQVSVTVRPS